MQAQAPGRASGLAMAMVGAIAFSGKAIIAKLAYRHGVDPVTLVMLRMLFALPVFLLLALWGSRGRQPLTRQQWAGILFLGVVGYFLSSTLDFVGLQYITASLERLILYLNPTLVVILGWLLYRKRILPGHWLGMAASYGGVVLVFGQEVGQQGAHSVLGSLLVLGSAISYAFYMIYSGRIVQAVGSLRLVGLASSVASVLCILQYALLLPVDTALQVAPAVVWLSLLNASLCTVVPIWLVMLAIERIGAGAAAQAGMIGPLSTILMGAWLLDEPLTAWVGLGTLLVLAGIWLFGRARA